MDVHYTRRGARGLPSSGNILLLSVVDDGLSVSLKATRVESVVDALHQR